MINASTGKVVAKIANGEGVDALGWDPAEKLIYIPAGRSGNITVVHQDSPDKYTTVATVPTMVGGKTIAVDSAKHVAYVFAPEYGPPPAFVFSVGSAVAWHLAHPAVPSEACSDTPCDWQRSPPCAGISRRSPISNRPPSPTRSARPHFTSFGS
ncbi:MAG: hypothetical protein EXR93_01165 [Gemmatimonadetes bacterium]|nr:hypothetical protein [Gemmatimonadota bacterium]